MHSLTMISELSRSNHVASYTIFDFINRSSSCRLPSIIIHMSKILLACKKNSFERWSREKERRVSCHVVGKKLAGRKGKKKTNEGTHYESSRGCKGDGRSRDRGWGCWVKPTRVGWERVTVLKEKGREGCSYQRRDDENEREHELPASDGWLMRARTRRRSKRWRWFHYDTPLVYSVEISKESRLHTSMAVVATDATL